MAITKASSNAVAAATKGDLVVGSATNDSGVLAVGSNDQVLTADSSTATGLKWATASAGGMTSLASGSLSGTSVTLSSINQTYNSLILRIINPRVTLAGGALYVQINGITAASYEGTYTATYQATNFNYTGRNGLWANDVVSQTTTNNQSAIYYFPNYAIASVYKIAECLTGSVAGPNGAQGIWCNTTITDAITSLTIKDNNGRTFDAGTYVLYGVK